MYQGRFCARSRSRLADVDRERRHPGHVVLDHQVEHVRELLAVEVVLDVEFAGAAEAVDLVVGVVVGREVLDAVERRVGDAVEVLDGGDAEFGEVLRGGLLDGDVRRGAQVLLVRFVEHRLEQVAVDAEDLRGRRRPAAFAQRTPSRTVCGVSGPAPRPRQDGV